MKVRGLLIGTMLACALSGCATSPDTGAVPPAGSQAVPGAAPLAVRAPREYLLTSAQPAPEDWVPLAEQGVVAVVNLRPDAEQPGRDERAEVQAAGMAYHQIPIGGADDLTAENASLLWKLTGSREGTVLVHCGSANRAGALLALGAAKEGGMTPEAALAFGKSAGLTSPVLEKEVRRRLGLPADPARGVGD